MTEETQDSQSAVDTVTEPATPLAEPTAAPSIEDAGQDGAADAKPTPEEAHAMFEENPGLASVLTTAGYLHRDGLITAE